MGLLLDQATPLHYAIGLDSINRQTLAITYPITTRLTPELEVTVYLHAFHLGDRERRCWTYITAGLSALTREPIGNGMIQQEMSLSLLLEDDDEPDDFPRPPLKLFQFLSEHVRAGKIMTSGRATTLGQSGLFGFDALFYLPAVAYESLPDLDNHLALMLVHRGEYEFARRYGLSRLVSRISRMCSCFPFPTWNTRRRPSLFEPGHQEPTMINERARTGLNSAVIRDETVRLNLAENGRETLVTLEEGQSVVLLADPVNVAEAALYWTPELRGAVTLIAAPTDFSASFVRVIVGHERYVRFIEDGVDLGVLRQDIAPLASSGFEGHQTPFLQFTTGLPGQPATPYQSGAGWLVPALFQQRWLDRTRGKLTLRRVDMTAPNNAQNSARENTGDGEEDRLWSNALGFSDAVLRAMADAMSEESEAFELLLTFSAGTMYPTANMSLNHDFVQYLRALLGKLGGFEGDDLAMLTLVFDVNSGRSRARNRS